MQWLDKPYPLLVDRKIKVSLSLFIGLVCFVFLMVFQPFQLDEVKGDVSFYTLGFGMNAVISMLLYYIVFPKLLPDLFDSESWTLLRHFLLMLALTFTIAVFNYLYNSTVGASIAPHHSLLKFIYITFSVGVLPILLISYISEKFAITRNASEASQLEQNMVEYLDQSKIVAIKGKDTSSDFLRIDLQDFLFAQAKNNYSHIHYFNNGIVASEMVRISLKELEIQMDDELIIRCHKSYLVNKSNVDKIDGNARSLILIMKYTDREVPVSRSFDRNLLIQLQPNRNMVSSHLQ